MMNSRQAGRNRRGFTLIELLVVIAIIVILMAILFPVFKTVREKAKQTQCQSNLHQISIALKSYREDFGRYPIYPFYDGERYQGGISALYPDYLVNKSLMICPDDKQIEGVEQTAKEKYYSSYNGWVKSAKDSWDFDTGTFKSPDPVTPTVTGPKRTYNWLGYTQEGWDAYSYDWTTRTTNMPYATTLPSWLHKEGLYLRHYPRLSNRAAPDNTIITHCVHHRDFYRKPLAQIDIYVNVGGEGARVNVSQQSATEDEDHPAKWVSQP